MTEEERISFVRGPVTQTAELTSEEVSTTETVDGADGAEEDNVANVIEGIPNLDDTFTEGDDVESEEGSVNGIEIDMPIAGLTEAATNGTLTNDTE